MGETWRFVVLRHSGGTVDKAHFDLMIQVPGQEKLWTWRIFDEPARWGPGTTAERIADHRAAYMTYEGEVSGGRGRVVRVQEGTAEVVGEDEERWHIRLSGREHVRELALPKAKVS